MRVSELQKGNDLIKLIRRINIEYRYTVFDYEPGEYFGVIHVSLHLHAQSPNYLFNRIERVKDSGSRRVLVVILLINSDVNTPAGSSILSKLQIDCISAGVQIVPSYSPMESAKYIESMHVQEASQNGLRNYKDTLKRVVQHTSDIKSEKEARKILFLSSIPKLSKTDAINLLRDKSIKEIVEETREHKLSNYKGIGKTKQKDIDLFFLEKFK